MKKILLIIVLLFEIIPLTTYAIGFNPEEVYSSVFVVQSNEGTGTGFCIKEKNIITNAHVVGNSNKVLLFKYDGSKINGTVIKKDEKIDLALISVDEEIKTIDASGVLPGIGQDVYAIGTPKGMPYTMTKGIVSATNRKVGENEFIQIDASVNSGNSGGPLLDESGRFIGVITLKAADAEGIGFAIKSDDVMNFVQNVQNETIMPDANQNNESMSDNDTLDENYSGLKSDYDFLKAENTILKIIILILLIVLSVFIIVTLKIKKLNKKRDEFDFEIEIEE